MGKTHLPPLWSELNCFKYQKALGKKLKFNYSRAFLPPILHMILAAVKRDFDLSLLEASLRRGSFEHDRKFPLSHAPMLRCILFRCYSNEQIVEHRVFVRMLKACERKAEFVQGYLGYASGVNVQTTTFFQHLFDDDVPMGRGFTKKIAKSTVHEMAWSLRSYQRMAWISQHGTIALDTTPEAFEYSYFRFSEKV